MTGIITVNPFYPVRFIKLNGCPQSHLDWRGNECPDSCIIPRNIQSGKSHFLVFWNRAAEGRTFLPRPMVPSLFSVNFHTSVLVIVLVIVGKKHNKIYVSKFSFLKVPHQTCMVKYPMELCSINYDNSQYKQI